MNTKLKYKLAGFTITAALVILVISVRFLRGSANVVEHEPSKVLGNPNAPVFIIEFSDYQCPFCRVIQPTIKKLLETYPNDLKIVFKHFPLNIHPVAFIAAEAAECANDQGKFWEYSETLNRIKSSCEPIEVPGDHSRWLGFAEGLKLNKDQFKQCMDSGVKKEVVRRNQEEARNFMAAGTPTLILNGKKILTDFRFESLSEVIDKELAKVRKS